MLDTNWAISELGLNPNSIFLLMPRDPKSQHPIVRVRGHYWLEVNGESVCASGMRNATVEDAIAIEQRESFRDRYSYSYQCDKRGFRQKIFDWLVLLLKRPTDAISLVSMSKKDRYPPMVSAEYDDSWDWSQCRWQRALAIKRGVPWQINPLVKIQ